METNVRLKAKVRHSSVSVFRINTSKALSILQKRNQCSRMRKKPEHFFFFLFVWTTVRRLFYEGKRNEPSYEAYVGCLCANEKNPVSLTLFAVDAVRNRRRCWSLFHIEKMSDWWGEEKRKVVLSGKRRRCEWSIQRCWLLLYILTLSLFLSLSLFYYFSHLCSTLGFFSMTKKEGKNREASSSLIRPRTSSCDDGYCETQFTSNTSTILRH